MKAPLFDINGKSKGTVDLQATHFGVTPNMSLIHRLLVLQQANGRIAIAHAKHRGEVAGSTKKMFKQKGTGNARMGDRRSPMRRGGGAVFGPRNERNFSLDMNRQERRLALTSLLSTKATENNVKVIESFGPETAKTKAMTSLLTAVEAKKPLIAITREEKNAILGAWNIVTTKVVNVEYLNPHDLLKYSDVIFSEASLKHLYEHFSK
ncbi:MAG: 50S ribosomal protein L4 [Candidatus Gracilibacteria bacterium]|nr:50S ribosomal protein L4 [Candidatus Gracilibacteria bacterium]